MILGMKSRWVWGVCFVVLMHHATALAQPSPAEPAPAAPPPAKDQPYIALGQAKVKKTILAIAPTIARPGAQTHGLIEAVRKVITNDLLFMDMFQVLSESAFIESPTSTPAPGLALDQFKVSDWSAIGTEFLIKTKITIESQTATHKSFAFEVHFHDITKAKTLFAKRYLAKFDDTKTVGHTAANDIVSALTGLPGIFLTKISMSCDVSKKKEIYIMDFDGSDVRQLTHHRSIAFAPAWSPDGSRLAYSLYNRNAHNQKNIDLFEYNFANQTMRMLSNRRGINSGAAYEPKGDRIALTMSYSGGPAIYLLNPENRSVARLTKSFGEEVDPSWSPDGKSLAYVSTRTGRPMVYRMGADGSNPTRLTFAGTFNATPSWSPQNNKIAFAGWLEKTFDVFIMNPDGTHIERLTKNQGKNEDPSFSPDGNFIVFSSDRAGAKNIYVMNVDGTFNKRLTFGLGNCVAPKWSNPPPPPRQMPES